MNIFKRFTATGFTAVKSLIHYTDGTFSEGAEVKASFGTFEDALIFAKATRKQYEGRSSIVHVDVYCNKSGDKVYNTYSG